MSDVLVRVREPGVSSNFRNSWKRGLPATVFYRDNIPFNSSDNMRTPIDLGIELVDGGTYTVVLSMLKGYTGTSSVAGDNQVSPCLFINGAYLSRLSTSNTASAGYLNQIVNFRYQYHDSDADPSKGIVNVMHTGASLGFGTAIHTTDLGVHVDAVPNVSMLNLTSEAVPRRAIVARRPKVTFGIGSFGTSPTTANCVILCKVSFLSTEFPQDRA